MNLICLAPSTSRIPSKLPFPSMIPYPSQAQYLRGAVLSVFAEALLGPAPWKKLFARFSPTELRRPKNSV